MNTQQYEFFPFHADPDITIEIALPAESNDPMVSAYKAGTTQNQYLIDLLLTFTRAGDHVMDLGCHVGTMSLPAAVLGRNVYCVDASELHTDAVRASAERNGLSNLHVLRYAVGEQDGVVSFQENGLFGMVVQDSKPGVIELPARSVSTLIKEFAIPRVDLVKMDIEGSERAAIRSMSELLKSDHAPIIIYESNGLTFELFGYSIKDMRQLLESFGYRTYRFEGTDFVYCPPNELQPDPFPDLIAIPEWRRPEFADRVREKWDDDSMVERSVAWGRSEHTHVRKYLYEAMQSEVQFPKDDPRMQDLYQDLKAEFGSAPVGQP